jgi:hypothetical protein
MLRDVYTWLIGEAPQILIAAMLLIGSVILFRRMRCRSAAAQLVGAGSYFAYTVLWGFSAYMAPYALMHPESSFARVIYPTDAEHPAFSHAYMVLKLVAFFFPVGFLLSMLRLARQRSAAATKDRRK